MARSANSLLWFALLIGCSSEPRGVTTWPAIGLYVERPDIEARLASIDSEASAAGLELVREVETKSESGTEYVVRAYRGLDKLERPTWAVRVASPFGVVMALGPGAADDAQPRQIVFEIDAGEGKLFASPGQLVAGGDPELLLRNARGELAIWFLGPNGASEIQIALTPRPIRLVDLSNGQLALAADVSVPPERTPPLVVLRIAAFDGTLFSERAPGAIQFYEEERERANIVPEAETVEARLDRRTLRAFYAIRAGEKKKDVAASFAREDVPPELRGALKERATWLEKQ